MGDPKACAAEKGLYSESKQDPDVDGTFALRESSESVTETPLAAMGERVLRGGVCIVGGLPAVEGEVGVVGRSKPLLPHGLPRPYKQTECQLTAIPDSLSQETCMCALYGCIRLTLLM